MGSYKTFSSRLSHSFNFRNALFSHKLWSNVKSEKNSLPNWSNAPSNQQVVESGSSPDYYWQLHILVVTHYMKTLNAAWKWTGIPPPLPTPNTQSFLHSINPFKQKSFHMNTLKQTFTHLVQDIVHLSLPLLTSWTASKIALIQYSIDPLSCLTAWTVWPSCLTKVFIYAFLAALNTY